MQGTRVSTPSNPPQLVLTYSPVIAHKVYPSSPPIHYISEKIRRIKLQKKKLLSSWFQTEKKREKLEALPNLSSQHREEASWRDLVWRIFPR